MKKLIMLIYLLTNVALCATCYGSYQPLFDLIDKDYKMQQAEFNKFNQSRLVYTFIPLEISPVFCLDSTTKALTKGDAVYLCNTIIHRKQYRNGSEDVVLAVVNYISWGNSTCTTKTYKILFYNFDSISKLWTVNRMPITITMQLQNKSECWYYCTSINK